MKKLFALALAAVMALSMTACGGDAEETTTAAPAETTTAAAAEETTAAEAGNEFGITDADEEITMMIAHSSAESTTLHKCCLEYERLIEEYSDGKIQVDVYPNGSLLSVAEMNEAIKDGSVQVIAGSPGAQLSTSLGIFELPNLVNSFEQASEIMQPGHEFRTILDGLFLETGVRLAAIEPCDFRMLTSNKEVRSYADLAGLQIRVMESPVPMSYWAQWGATPTPLAWSEVYMALQQGMVEAQENPYDSIIGSNLQEVQDYLISTKHVMFYTAFMMNDAWYQALPDSYKAVIDQASLDVAPYCYDEGKASSEANLEFLTTEGGMEFIELADEDYAQMRANASEADAIVKESIGEELFTKMMTALGF